MIRMGWLSNGTRSAKANIAREATARPQPNLDERLRAMRDDALSCLGKGTGGWSDQDIRDYADEIDRHLSGRGKR